MRYFVIILVLAIHVALVKSRGSLSLRPAAGITDGARGDGSIRENVLDKMSDLLPSDGDGSVNLSAGIGFQIGGCSIGASGSGGANGANGSASGSVSANCEMPVPVPGEIPAPVPGEIPVPGYTYVINATRTVNGFSGNYPAAYMSYKVLPTQNLTWFRSVGPDDPLMIQGFIFGEYRTYFYNDDEHLLDSCIKQPNGTWPLLLTEVVRKSVLLGGDCSVKKGSYMINQDVDPITVTLPEMLDCGDSSIGVNTYVARSPEDLSAPTDSKWEWAFELYFDFTIDDNCNEHTTDDN